VISSLILTLVPLIVNAIIFTVMSFTPTCAGNFTISEIWQWLFSGISYTLILLSLTAAVNMMTGNTVAALIFTAGFAVLPALFYSVSEMIFSDTLYGYTSNNYFSGLRYIYIDPDETSLIYYVVYSAVLYGLAYVLYRIRKIESNGEIIAFKWLKPVFIGIISILASGLSYAYFHDILQAESIFTLIPFGVLGAGIAHMISKKAIDFKGSIKPVAIYIVCALCFIGAVKFDLTGFEARVPNEKDIKKIHISASILSYYYYGVENMPGFTSEEGIKAICDFHREITTERSINKHGPRVYICYELKGGRKLQREYTVNFIENEEKLKPIYETEEFRRKSFMLLHDDPKEITHIELTDRRLAGEKLISLYPDNPIMNELKEAVKKDMLSYTYEDYTSPSHIYNVDITWERDIDGKKVAETDFFKVTPNCKNTLKVLKKIPEFKNIPTPEDIEQILVRITSSGSDVREKVVSEKSVQVEKSDKDTVVTDLEQIEKIYSEYGSMIAGNHFYDYNRAIHVYLEYTLKNGHNFDVSCSYEPERLPEVFRKYIK